MPILVRQVLSSFRPPISIRQIAVDIGLPLPFPLSALLKFFITQTFNAIVTTPGPDSLGGNATLLIRANGNYKLQLHLHNSGAPDYSFRIGSFLTATSDSSQLVFALFSHGSVHGLSPGGSRDFDDPQEANSPMLREHWEAFSRGSLEIHLKYKDDTLSWIWDQVLEKILLVLGAVALGGPATLVIFGASLIGDVTDLRARSEMGLIGLIAAEGVYLLCGPIAFLPVFIGGAIVSTLLFKRRSLSPADLAIARSVFKDTIPYERIILTNLENQSGTAFSVPSIDGNYIIGLGNQLGEDVVLNPITFIHELTHVWQFIYAGLFLTMCESAINKPRQVVEGEESVYGSDASKPWSCYGLEQQAEIIQDWYQLSQILDEEELSKLGMTRFIRENILTGDPDHVFTF